MHEPSKGAFARVGGALLLLLAGSSAAGAGQVLCSPAVTNPSCTVTLDRDAPSSPLPMRLKRGATLTVEVAKRPQDSVTMDATFTDVASPDPLAALFAAFLPSAKQIQYSTRLTSGGAAMMPLTNDPALFDPSRAALKPLLKKLQWINTQQKLLIDALKVGKATIDEGAKALRTFTSRPTSNWTVALVIGERERVAAVLEQASHVDAQAGLGRGLHEALDEAVKLYASLPGADPLPADDLLAVGQLLNDAAAQQAEIDASTASIAAAATAAREAAAALRRLDPDSCLRQSRTFTAGASHSRALALKVKSEDTLTKKSIDLATVAAVWAETKWEVSAGAVFSALPNRSFQNTAQIVDGKVQVVDGKTNTTITETTTTPSVVPFALAHWRLGETAKYDRRWAGFLTGGMGISPYSGSTDFAGGFTLGYRSLFISPLLHLARDLRLTSGLEPGKSLGSSPPAIPTERFWKPTFGVAVTARVF